MSKATLRTLVLGALMVASAADARMESDCGLNSAQAVARRDTLRADAERARDELKTAAQTVVVKVDALQTAVKNYVAADEERKAIKARMAAAEDSKIARENAQLKRIQELDAQLEPGKGALHKAVQQAMNELGHQGPKKSNNNDEIAAAVKTLTASLAPAESARVAKSIREFFSAHGDDKPAVPKIDEGDQSGAIGEAAARAKTADDADKLLTEFEQGGCAGQLASGDAKSAQERLKKKMGPPVPLARPLTGKDARPPGIQGTLPTDDDDDTTATNSTTPRVPVANPPVTEVQPGDGTKPKDAPHTVKKGETLSKIAQEIAKSIAPPPPIWGPDGLIAFLFRAIEGDRSPNPNLIFPGQIINIAAAKEALKANQNKGN